MYIKKKKSENFNILIIIIYIYIIIISYGINCLLGKIEFFCNLIPFVNISTNNCAITKST